MLVGEGPSEIPPDATPLSSPDGKTGRGRSFDAGTVLRALESGKISEEEADRILRLPDEELAEAAARLAARTDYDYRREVTE